MRLFHEHPELTLRELTLPFLDARKRVARYPQDRAPDQARRGADDRRHGLGGLPGRGAHRTSGRKVTLVDYSLVPDMAVVDPRADADACRRR